MLPLLAPANLSHHMIYRTGLPFFAGNDLDNRPAGAIRAAISPADT